MEKSFQNEKRQAIEAARKECLQLLVEKELDGTRMEEVKNKFFELLEVSDVPAGNKIIVSIIADTRRFEEIHSYMIGLDSVYLVPYSPVEAQQRLQYQDHMIEDWAAYQLAVKSIMNLKEAYWNISYATKNNSFMAIGNKDHEFVNIRYIKNILGNDSDITRKLVMKDGSTFHSSVQRKVLLKRFRHTCRITSLPFQEYGDEKHLVSQMTNTEFIHLSSEKFSKQIITKLNRENWTIVNGDLTDLTYDIIMFKKLKSLHAAAKKNLKAQFEIEQLESIQKAYEQAFHKKMKKRWGKKWAPIHKELQGDTQ